MSNCLENIVNLAMLIDVLTEEEIVLIEQLKDR